MTELKTIKDILKTQPYSVITNLDKGNTKGFFISVDDLKAEAIKHILYLGKKNVVSEWIKYFAGITEDDLK